MKKLLIVLMALGMSLGVWGVARGASPSRGNHATVNRFYTLDGTTGDHWLVAECPKGKHAIGGGYELAPDGAVDVWASVPGGKWWILKVRKSASPASPVTVWAVCR